MNRRADERDPEAEKVLRDFEERKRQREREAQPQTKVAYTFDELRAATFPVRESLISRGQSGIIRRGTIGEIFAYRGMGKSWTAYTLALIAAAQAEAFGWHAPEPCNVLFIDGEMPADLIRERFDSLGKTLGVKSCARLSIIGADWLKDYLPRLDTPEGQAFIEPFVAPADLIFFDNRSCLFDPAGEKDPEAWQPAQDYLLALRRRGKAEMLVHHANRGGGARGLSKAEDVMDVILKLTRPANYRQDQGARFLVEFDKARGLYGPAAVPFITALTEDGWVLEDADAAETDGTRLKIREFIKTSTAVGEMPKSASAAVRGAGVNRQSGLAAFATMLKDGEIVQHPNGGYALA